MNVCFEAVVLHVLGLLPAPVAYLYFMFVALCTQVILPAMACAGTPALHACHTCLPEKHLEQYACWCSCR